MEIIDGKEVLRDVILKNPKITGGTMSGTIVAGVYTTSTNPAINAAVTTAIIDANDGVIITLTAAGNAQTIQNPTAVAVQKEFIVANNNTSTHSITVNTVVIQPGEAQKYFWDLTAWLTLEAISASQISATPHGAIAATQVQAYLDELEDEKIATSAIGVAAGSVVQVDQAVTAWTRATTTTLGTTLNGTLGDTSEPIAAFNGVAGVTYHCRCLGAGAITHHATNLIVTQTGASIAATATGDTFDVEMLTASTCRIKNYLKADGIALVTELSKDLTPQLGGDLDGTGRIITGVMNSFYGVSWDEVANTYVRTGALTGVAVGSSPGDALLPIQAAMRRCILDDNGVVQYYLDPTNSYNRLGHAPSITGTDDVGTASKVSHVGKFTLAAAEYVGKYVHNITTDTYAFITAKDSNNVLSISANIFAITNTFEICTAGIAYGGDGQVMVEVPLFYYRYGYVGTTHTHDTSLVPLDGFSVHHDFVKNGEVVPYRYYGAYEGSMYDASTGAMVPPASIPTAYTITSGDKLCSLSGQYPKTNETRNEFRIMAAMRGDGWRQLVFDDASAYQLLYLVEYASFQSQAMIGQGRTQLSGGSWVADSYIGQCGKSNLNGNGTGNVEGNTNAAYMSYRGIENIYGNVWKFLDGININEHLPYVCNNDSDFQDDTAEGYTALDVSLPAANNYQQTLFPQDRGFLPKTVGAATTQIGDYYYQDAGWRVVLLGGFADNGVYAGAFDVTANNASSYFTVAIGGRLAF